MKPATSISLLPLLFTLLTAACDDDRLEPNVRVESIEVRVIPADPDARSRPAPEPTEVEACEAAMPPPILAEFDPGPVELPAPVAAPPVSRAALQCTDA